MIELYINIVKVIYVDNVRVSAKNKNLNFSK